MMTKLKKTVDQLVQSELDLASEQHGERFHSAHEAYAVIREEQDEASQEFQDLRDFLWKFWEEVKANRDGKIELHDIEELAINAACECIQVAAMAQKAQRGYEVDEDKPDD